MSGPEYRRLRIACRLGVEWRTTEVHIRVDSIDHEQWRRKPDGEFSHAALEQLAREWVFDQLQVRTWTGDTNAGPHLFHLSTPGENAHPVVTAARDNTINISEVEPDPARVCPECGEERDRGEPWQHSGPDSWKA